MSAAPGLGDGGEGPVLVTGGAGFIGSNIADRLLRDGRRVRIYDSIARAGVQANVDWLKSRGGERLEVVVADVRDHLRLAQAVEGASAVFHMAAQVAVTTSLVDPVEDFDVNVRATLALLEAVRAQVSTKGRRIPVVFASTNKVYGDLSDMAFERRGDRYAPTDARLREHGVGEDRPLDFHTPYGCSKGAADQYVLDWARSYDLPTCVMRMSCVYGPRQMGTEDQGWVAHFLIRALEGEEITLYGDGRQVRDILQVSDVVDAYMAALQRIEEVRGRAFNLGGGPDNAVSLRELIARIGQEIGRPVDVRYADWRQGDQRFFVADMREAERALGLAPRTPWRDGVAGLADWLAAHRGLPRRAEPPPRHKLAAGAAGG